MGRRLRATRVAPVRRPLSSIGDFLPETTPWRRGDPAGAAFSRSALRAPVAEAARSLLGARLVSTVGGRRVVGVIVETEAYGGPDDPASHAAVRAGRTARNASMFAEAGRAYVYQSYGVHWCLNVVTGPPGQPQAVLIRGADVVEGGAAALARRGREPLAAGPGRLCQALAVDGELDGHDLADPPLRLMGGWTVDDARVGVSGRVGVARAAAWPLRFYVRGAAGVTPGVRVDLPWGEPE